MCLYIGRCVCVCLYVGVCVFISVRLIFCCFLLSDEDHAGRSGPEESDELDFLN